jgi:hypothetical protein
MVAFFFVIAYLTRSMQGLTFIALFELIINFIAANTFNENENIHKIEKTLFLFEIFVDSRLILSEELIYLLCFHAVCSIRVE